MNPGTKLLLALAILASPAVAEVAVAAGPPACAGGGGVLAARAATGRTWIVKPSDNICGLSDATQLSNPARVDYKKLLAATPEMKEIVKEGIDPQSPEGIQLRTEAADRVAKAAEKVRQSLGHCSVWKAIRHRDGRKVPDITKKVLAEL